MIERIVFGLLEKAKEILNGLVFNLKLLKNERRLDKGLSSLLSNIH